MMLIISAKSHLNMLRSKIVTSHSIKLSQGTTLSPKVTFRKLSENFYISYNCSAGICGAEHARFSHRLLGVKPLRDNPRKIILPMHV